jgi:mannose-P-dolichol utilization defect protein 1
MILLIISRIPQIITNFLNKSTGQLAFFTFLLNFLGGIARLGTVLVETSDFSYQLPYYVGTSLSGILVIQFLLYWNSPQEDKKVAPSSKGSKPVSGSSSPTKKGTREKIE